MIFIHSNLTRVAHHKTAPFPQETCVRVGTRNSLQPAFAQLLQPSRHFRQSFLQLLHHGSATCPFVGVFLITLLLPLTDRPPQFASLLPQTFFCLQTIPRCRCLDPRRVDRHL